MPTRRHAAAITVGLSLLFVLVYCLCNWVTGLRSNVGSLYMNWESAIPFVPLLILPYLSLDFFFVVAPFLAESRNDLMTLARRITAAILAAGACFLIFPMKFAFPRPIAEGDIGFLFDQFRSLDAPFNEFPSLHVALCILLADFYFRITDGIFRIILGVWFALILISPLFTYQHHVIDIAGGAVLAIVCLHFIANDPLRQPTTGNRRVAGCYACAAVALAVLAFTYRPWSLFILWPSVSCAVAAVAYLGLGPGIYRKRGGALSWSTWVLLWPLLLGQRLSLLYYARTGLPYSKLTDRVWIGRQLSRRQAKMLAFTGIRAVLDLTCEFSEPRNLRRINYLQLPILDLTAPSLSHINAGIAFIRQHTPHGIVYVHCKAGYSRTAAIAGAYLLSTGQAATAEEAQALLRKARSGMIIRREARLALEHFAGRPESPLATPSLSSSAAV